MWRRDESAEGSPSDEIPGVAQQTFFGSRNIVAALEERSGGLRLARGSVNVR